MQKPITITNIQKIINNDLDFLKNIRVKIFLTLFDNIYLERFIETSPINPITKRHLIYFTESTIKYEKFLIKCINSFISQGIPKNQILVFSLDEKIKNICDLKGIQTFLFNLTSFSRITHWEIVRFKQVIQYYFICRNVDALIFDTDIVICNDIQNELNEKLNEDVDIQIMDEELWPRFNVNISQSSFRFNTGFMLVKSTESNKKFFQKWISDGFIEKHALSSENQFRFNFILRNNGTVVYRNYEKNDIKIQLPFNDHFNLTFHFLNPIKFINFCSFIGDFSHMNRFRRDFIEETVKYAKIMNLTRPSLVHFACAIRSTKKRVFEKFDYNEIYYDNLTNYANVYKYI